MSEKETAGPVTVRLVGTHRVSVPGRKGVVKKGQTITMPGLVHCEALPRSRRLRVHDPIWR